MPSSTNTPTNVVSQNLPEVSAYFAAQSSAGGAYGFASAAEVNTMIYTVNALVAAVLARKIGSAT